MWTDAAGWVWARGGGPAAEWGHRVGARAIDITVEIVLFFLTTTVVSAIAPLRPALNWVAGLLVVAAYETICVAAWGGTAGKLATGVRVIGLDRRDTRVSFAAAAERGLMVAFFVCAVLPLPIIVGSALVSPNRRGLHDRRSGTFVVERATPPIRRHELLRFEAGERPPPPTPFAPTGSIDLRVRARLYRLEGSVVLLVLVTVLLGIVSIFPIGWLVLAASAVFLIGFVVDETIAIHRRGGTDGHHLAGLRVVDVDTGRWPSTGRALARALVLTLVYVPLVQIGLWIWVVASPRWRGLHDHAGHTVVIRVADAHPRLHDSPASAAEIAARLRT
ncbi:MAG: RDD family protein [Acidimicrobiales bacterium]